MSRIHKAIRLVCLLILVGSLLLGVGVAYGRYSSTIQDILTFQAGNDTAARTISIRSKEGWYVADDSLTLTFSLTNAGDVPDQRAYLRLSATEGLDPAAVSVTLTVDEVVYTAVPRPVEKGDPLYERMGPGTEYRFVADETELSWEVATDRTYVFSVQGVTDVSLLHLTASEAFD